MTGRLAPHGLIARCLSHVGQACVSRKTACLHKAKEPYSLSRRGVMEKQSAEKHMPPEQPDANGASGSTSPAGRFRFL